MIRLTTRNHVTTITSSGHVSSKCRFQKLFRVEPSAVSNAVRNLSLEGSVTAPVDGTNDIPSTEVSMVPQSTKHGSRNLFSGEPADYSGSYFEPSFPSNVVASSVSSPTVGVTSDATKVRIAAI